MSNTEIWFIRHGQTEWNSLRRLQGHTDIGLDDTGRLQAEKVAQYIAQHHQSSRKFTALYSSDLKRAVETASSIKQCIALPLTTDSRLREQNLGVFQGRTVTEINEHPALADQFAQFCSDTQYLVPNGESAVDMYSRCEKAILDIVDKNIGGCVLVVTHGGFLRKLHHIVNNLPLDTPVSLATPNSCICLIRHISGKENPFEVLRWGSTEHLDYFISSCDDVCSFVEK